MEDKDIKKLLDVLWAREDLIKKDFSELKFEFETLRSSIGGYSEKFDRLFGELEKITHKLHGQEKSISKIARRFGVTLGR